MFEIEDKELKISDELNRKILEEKQYENMSFTVDDFDIGM